MRSPIECVALIMDVAECDFKRACRLLGLNPVDMLKEIPDLVVIEYFEAAKNAASLIFTGDLAWRIVSRRDDLCGSAMSSFFFLVLRSLA
jgi:hypothetical protein